MPDLRRGDISVVTAPRVTFEAAATRLGEVEMTRRRRAGRGRGLDGAAGTLPVETRNGLPEFKPYVWKGNRDDVQ
jgi:hypothetical protein